MNDLLISSPSCCYVTLRSLCHYTETDVSQHGHVVVTVHSSPMTHEQIILVYAVFGLYIDLFHPCNHLRGIWRCSWCGLIKSFIV